jgi:cell division protease FtsH
MKDLSEAYDRVTYGNKSNINLTDEDKKWTAYHEAGHAIIACMHPKDDVVKATIIPRKGFLGFVSHKPKEEYYSQNKEILLSQIKICLASYASEELVFGSTSTGVGGGCNSDFHVAMDIARNMVFSYGMGKSGLIGDFRNTHPYVHNLSETLKEKLETDVQDILQTCLKEVKAFLSSHRDLLDHFAEKLIEKGDLEYDEIKTIFDKFGIKPASQPEKNI